MNTFFITSDSSIFDSQIELQTTWFFAEEAVAALLTGKLASCATIKVHARTDARGHGHAAPQSSFTHYEAIDHRVYVDLSSLVCMDHWLKAVGHGKWAVGHGPCVFSCGKSHEPWATSYGS